MTLSNNTISKIADALKPEVVDYIYSSEKYGEFMQDMIVSAIDSKMGEMDDDLIFELGMLVFDRIELK
jgi:hypothetical protein